MMARKLTNKQRIFIDEYLKCWNGTEAARRAKYKSPQVEASRLLSNAIISGEIKQRLDESAMSAEEALKHLADIARGNLGDFLTIDHNYIAPDLEKAKEQGKLHLLKKYKAGSKIHGAEIELYDRQKALDTILKAHGKFNHKQEIVITIVDKIATLVTSGQIEESDVKERWPTLADEIFAKVANA